MTLSIKRLNDGGVIITATDTINLSELKNLKNALYRNQHSVKNIHYQMVDYRQAEDLDLAHEDIWLMALQDKAALEINPRMLIALVCDRDVTYGLARMWSAYTESTPQNTGVFRSVEQAQEWIMQRQIAQALRTTDHI